MVGEAEHWPNPTADDYRQFLSRMFGFVVPVERAITEAPHVDRYVDVRRFTKEQLLRRDLLSARMSAAQIAAIRECAVPIFKSGAEALGWAYVIERTTLGHHQLFRHFARTLPGEVAFASSYLKCYFGSVGEMWGAFGVSLDAIAKCGEPDCHETINAARTAFRFYATWRGFDELDEPDRTSDRATMPHDRRNQDPDDQELT